MRISKSFWMLGLLLSAQAYAASFDCGKASTNVERMICDNWEVSHLDEEMVWAISEQLKKTVIASSLIESQNQWISFVRNKCANDGCLKTVYYERLKELGVNKKEFEKASVLSIMQYLDLYEKAGVKKKYIEKQMLELWGGRQNECQNGSIKKTALQVSKDIYEIRNGNFEIIEGETYESASDISLKEQWPNEFITSRFYQCYYSHGSTDEAGDRKILKNSRILREIRDEKDGWCSRKVCNNPVYYRISNGKIALWCQDAKGYKDTDLYRTNYPDKKVLGFINIIDKDGVNYWQSIVSGIYDLDYKNTNIYILNSKGRYYYLFYKKDTGKVNAFFGALGKEMGSDYCSLNFDNGN